MSKDFSKSIPMVDDAATKKGMEKVLLGNAVRALPSQCSACLAVPVLSKAVFAQAIEMEEVKDMEFPKSGVPNIDPSKNGSLIQRPQQCKDPDLREDVQEMPDPEKESKKQGLEGMGGLGRNLEFMMMKLLGVHEPRGCPMDPWYRPLASSKGSELWDPFRRVVSNGVLMLCVRSLN